MVDWEDIIENALDKEEIENDLKGGPIPIPENDMEPSDWTSAKVVALCANPVYTGIGPYPKTTEDEVWIGAVTKLIEKLGPHLVLRILLDSLRQSLKIE